MMAEHDPTVRVSERTPNGEEYVTIVDYHRVGSDAFALFIGDVEKPFRSMKDAMDYCYERGYLKRPHAVS